MYPKILENKRIYLVLSRRQVSKMLKYIGKNNGNATTNVFDIELIDDGEDLQANFTDNTNWTINHSNKK